MTANRHLNQTNDKTDCHKSDENPERNGNVQRARELGRLLCVVCLHGMICFALGELVLERLEFMQNHRGHVVDRLWIGHLVF
jgi:hypothetical protein